MTVYFGVNCLAIVVAAIAAVAIGIIYYGILGVGDRQSRILGASPTRPGPAQVAFERRPWAVWVLQGVHDLVAEIVVAGIVTLWR